MAITVVKLELKVTPTYRNRSLVAPHQNVNMLSYNLRHLLERPRKINVFWVTHLTHKPSRS